jgi:hypothetical protein
MHWALASEKRAGTCSLHQRPDVALVTDVPERAPVV